MLTTEGEGIHIRPIHKDGMLPQTETVPSRREALEALAMLQKLNVHINCPKSYDIIRRFILMR